MSWKYFKDQEVKGLNIQLVDKLDLAREKSGIPFLITSGYRDPVHNWEVGGVDASSHTSGNGVDIFCDEPRKRFLMVEGLIKVGINRIGIYDKHIHTDIDDTKSPQVIWLGLSH